MKTIGILALLMMATVVLAKPMTSSVNSWEGDFTLKNTKTPIRIKGLPTIILWEYELKSGSKGTAIGFSTGDGDMIRAPKPQEEGIQPVYTGHFVLVNDDKTADILVTYAVQGNGGWKVVERYVFDGKTLTLKTVTMNGGKPDFEWFRETKGAEQSASDRFAQALAAGGQFKSVLSNVRAIVSPGDSAADHSAILATANKTIPMKNGTAYYFNWYARGGTGPKSEQGDGYILIKVDQSSGKIELVTGNVEGN